MEALVASGGASFGGRRDDRPPLRAALPALVVSPEQDAITAVDAATRVPLWSKRVGLYGSWSTRSTEWGRTTGRCPRSLSTRPGVLFL